jgi:hypothetical protein
MRSTVQYGKFSSLDLGCIEDYKLSSYGVGTAYEVPIFNCMYAISPFLSLISPGQPPTLACLSTVPNTHGVEITKLRYH